MRLLPIAIVGLVLFALTRKTPPQVTGATSAGGPGTVSGGAAPPLVATPAATVTAGTVAASSSATTFAGRAAALSRVQRPSIMGRTGELREAVGNTSDLVPPRTPGVLEVTR